MKTTVKKSAILRRLQIMRRVAVENAWKARTAAQKFSPMRRWYHGWMCGNRSEARSLRRLIRDIENGNL